MKCLEDEKTEKLNKDKALMLSVWLGAKKVEHFITREYLKLKLGLRPV